MNIIDKLENIARGRIYSARFVVPGLPCYLQRVDPFVIDMSSPRTPRVLGALKVQDTALPSWTITCSGFRQGYCGGKMD